MKGDKRILPRFPRCPDCIRRRRCCELRPHVAVVDVHDLLLLFDSDDDHGEVEDLVGGIVVCACCCSGKQATTCRGSFFCAEPNISGQLGRFLHTICEFGRFERTQ